MLFGLAFAGYTVQHYPLGTLNNMGPGMFPMGLGVTLAIMGVAMSALALFRRGKMPEIRVRSPLFVVLGVGAFALLLPFGLTPAVLGVALLSSFADTKVKWTELAVLSVSLCLLSWLIFGLGLGLPIAMLRWPF